MTGPPERSRPDEGSFPSEESAHDSSRRDPQPPRRTHLLCTHLGAMLKPHPNTPHPPHTRAGELREGSESHATTPVMSWGPPRPTTDRPSAQALRPHLWAHRLLLGQAVQDRRPDVGSCVPASRPHRRRADPAGVTTEIPDHFFRSVGPECGTQFYARSDTKYCTSRCRQRAFYHRRTRGGRAAK